MEGADSREMPNGLLVRQSLVAINAPNEVTIQVTNLRPVSVKLFKGKKVGILPPGSR